MKPGTRTSLTTLIILCQRFVIPAAAGAGIAALVEYVVFEVMFQTVKAQWGDLSMVAVVPVFFLVSHLVRQYTLQYGNSLLKDLWKEHRDEVPEGFSVLIGEEGPSPAVGERKEGKKDEENQ
jgi:hypothetical protein